ncbi:type IX secretion system membrane protein PorP/SprF [Flavobacteriaceae bacterium]|jgi:type IX secretion system PorP/SprF family membrane protein|nr:type IX secretion system membrane protein PorP/SprF [Flavobacteriaceae bacterium]MDB9731215.1 type IX secretion system membrane protein PorP/SprF [Flavobacteriaceae bacterium]
MRKIDCTYLIFIIAAIFSHNLYGQDRFIHNLSNLPQFVNPSYFSFKDQSRIGIASEFSSNKGGDNSQHQYAFATNFFEENDFQLGVEIMTSKLDNSGLNYSTAKFSYIYKLQLKEDWYFYPGLSLGYSRYNFDYGNLIFSDQINILTGQVSNQTIDPIIATTNIGYIDIGASFMAHNNYNLSFGASVHHLNQPKISSELLENGINLSALFSAQLGYEINLNRYQQGSLPNYSYLYLFQNFVKQGPVVRASFFQEITLANLMLGLNEHVSSIESINFLQVGVLVGVKLEAFDIGFNYNLPMGNSSFVVPNALELFINFDISPNRLRNRKDFSRFY